MRSIVYFIILIEGIVQVYAVSFSEIMYDPQGSDTSREWVEVYNDTGSPLSLTSWKFFESGTNHSINGYSSSTSIASGEYGVIADNPSKFLVDYPDYQGVLYDSSFSLSNSGELLILKDANGNQIDSVTYSPSLGGNDDGSTLSYASSSWVRGHATPGAANILEEKSASASNTSSGVTPVTSSPSADIMLLVPERITAISGADTNFSVKAVTGSTRNTIEGLSYTWSFGDGGTSVGKSVTYHYQYPGFYLATVKAENESYIEKARVYVKVVDPDIRFISYGFNQQKGGYLVLKNNLDEEVDISNWIIDINSTFYTLPENTLLLPKKETFLSGRALLFSTSTNDSLLATSTIRILYPDHTLFLTTQNPLYKNEVTQQLGQVYPTSTSVSILKSTKTFLKPYTEHVRNIPKETTIISTTTEVMSPKKSEKDTRIASFLKNMYSHFFK